MSQLFQELKRRNVFRVAIAYAAVAWLVLQAADIVLDNIAAPDWLMKALMFFLAIGFPVAVLFAWAYEMTPEGLKREHEVDRTTSITHQTGQKLNRTIIAVLIVAVAFLLVDKFMLQDSTPASDTTDKSVAVLPFVAMSRGPDDEYFADGLTEEILNSLTRIPELLVTARTSAFFFKGQDIPIPEIAVKLGVAHIVEGSVRRDGNRLRVTAQLIRASDGFHLWSKNYDRETEDTFGVQTDIAEEISSALGVVLDDAQLARMHADGIRNPEAFIALQKGIGAFYDAHGEPNQNDLLREVNKHFEKALSLEPGLSDAYMFHADYYTHALLSSADEGNLVDEQLRTLYAQLVDDIDNAIRTAADDSQRNAASLDLAILTGNWRGLTELFDKVVITNNCRSSGWADVIGASYGKTSEFEQMSARITECDPISFSGWRWLALAQTWSGNTKAAIETSYRGLENSSHTRIRQQLVLAHLAEGRIDDAEQIVDRDARGDFDTLSLQLDVALAKGDGKQADIIMDRLREIDAQTSVGVVSPLARRGDRDAANKRAAEIDARQFGYLRLMLIPGSCMCGAPWDLEYTPNFAKLLEDAELPWPPVSPINWPLKDW